MEAFLPSTDCASYKGLELTANQLYQVEHLPCMLGEPLMKLHSQIGIPIDQILLLSCFVAAIPLGLIHKRLPYVGLKHFSSIFFGTLFLYLEFGFDTWQPVVSSLCVYVLVHALPAKVAPLTVWIFTMTWLSIGQIHRMMTMYLDFTKDYTMAQMVITVKMIMFAYNYADGYALSKGKRLHEKEHMHQFRAERAITNPPSLIEFFSYVLFFPAVLVGPCFEFVEYMDYCTGKIFKKANLESAPSSILPALSTLLKAGGVYIMFEMHRMMPVKDVVYGDFSPLYRALYLFATVTCVRAKYYFAWYMSESGCIASGFGFNGRTEHGYAWDRLNNIDWWAVEFGDSFPTLTNGWNKGVNNWLKNYIYNRVPFNKFLANVCTKLTSAFWHGFYPGYYIFFLSAAILSPVEDEMKRVIKPFLCGNGDAASQKSTIGSYMYSIFGWVVCHALLNYMAVGFLVLEFYPTVDALKSVYFYGHIFCIVFIVFCKVAFPHRKSSSKSAKAQAADPTAAAVQAVASEASSKSQ